MTLYIGNNDSKAKKVLRIFVGDINNKASLAKQIFIGDSNGKAKKIYDINNSITYPTSIYSLRNPIPQNMQYIYGGVIGDYAYVINQQYSYKYDIINDVWIELSAGGSGLQETSGTICNGKVYVLGDYRAKTIKYYDTITDTWTTTSASLPAYSQRPNCCGVGTRVYAMGGYNTGTWTFNNYCGYYDDVTKTWTSLSSGTTTKYGCLNPIVHDGIIYMIGIVLFSGFYSYNTLTNTFSSIQNPGGRYVFGNFTGLVGDYIYMLGSYSDSRPDFSSSSSTFSDCYRYNIKTKVWEKISSLNKAKGRGLSFTYGGIIFMIGGTDSNGVINENQLYYPSLDKQ